MSKRFTSYLMTIIIISLAIAPAFALGEGNINLLLIAILGLSPMIILLYRRVYYIDILLVLFMLSILIFPLIFHPESMRWSTVLYSYMFTLTFIAYNKLLHKNFFSINNYVEVLKYLIYAYFIVLLIQQFCVLNGLPIFNESNYYPSAPWKLNSLSAEPSHSARIVALLMYVYITAKEIFQNKKYNFSREIKEDKWVWVSFLWTMLTMGSGTAFLFIAVVLLKFMRFKNIFFLSIIVITIVIGIEMLNVNTFKRTFDVLIATLTFDIDTIMKADHSASLRIVPMMIISQMVDLTTLNGWFGHGIDFTGTFLSTLIYGLPPGSSGGGMFQLWMEYGFLSFFLFVFFSLNAVYQKNEYLSLIFWFLLVFMYGVNNQMVWLAIILLYTNKYFYKRKN